MQIIFFISKACSDERFLFHVIVWRDYSWYKFIFTQSVFAVTMLLRSLKQVFWKKSVFYVRYLRNSNKANIPKVQAKVFFLIVIFENVVFNSFACVNVPHFSS